MIMRDTVIVAVSLIFLEVWMKKIYTLFLGILIALIIAVPVYAADPNLDGGGGNMGEATGQAGGRRGETVFELP